MLSSMPNGFTAEVMYKASGNETPEDNFTPTQKPRTLCGLEAHDESFTDVFTPRGDLIPRVNSW